MPAGYSSRCKACNSPHRAQIEEWARSDGLSPRAISARLQEKFSEQISHKAIWRHLSEHFDVKAEAREQYQKSRAAMQESVKKQLSDIEMLDSIARESYDLHKSAKEWLKELVENKGKIPKSLVDLLSSTAGEVRQHLRAKAELLGDDPDSKLADAMVATLEELQELYQDANSRQEGTDS